MELRRADGGTIAVEVLGEPDAPAVLLCHGLADSRLAVYGFAGAADALGLRFIAPDRPGTGGTDARRLTRVVDWAEEATLVLDTLDVDSVALLGVSGGGAFAAACASALPDRVRSLLLIAPLGPPAWPTCGMAAGQRASLRIARHAPALGGWLMGRLATLARRAPGQFLRLATGEMPDSDRRALAQPDERAAFLTNYVEAFHRGSRGVAQDLRVLTLPWGFDLESIRVPTSIHHGDADTTVPLQHARRFAAAIPGARLHVHPGQGHFSILASPERTLAMLAA
ncbi:alpha/beta hydrolase [Actinacidiphila glaucinigra]|uniref:alpha/beta fold hydrolase n=1 Tax=Actinacidiphila glaucinigra TaxID=235986 RepID=UPI002DDBF07F|nr:alpha/beta fold hydrolase [Actinacidiphila glaucinigra]WSD59284.1 alpha/beta hydrolase [Actinacidiphila glaucinigra]